MLARCSSAALQGLDALEVTIEADITPGLPGLALVGLPDTAVHEARERVRAALRNCGFRVPLTRVVVNLAPADLRKAGPGFDLPIALGLLVASGQLDPALLEGVWSSGELGLDGRLQPIRGALAIALAARRHGARALLLPEAVAAEASLVGGLPIWSSSRLDQLVERLRGQRPWPRPSAAGASRSRLQQAASRKPQEDLPAVRGQPLARRALEIAAAGGHHLLLVGPPGGGKTMLARCLAGVVPALANEEAV
ncbi:MAG: magnesium chelatase domain-containing protein, partial [Prochlorococcaceae cyanobacterium]